MPTLTYYDVLEVTENASDVEIKKSYRALQQEFHPDKVRMNPDSKRAAEFLLARVQDISEAYAVLGTPDKRAAYDAKLRSERAKASQPSADRSPAGPPPPPNTAQSAPFAAASGPVTSPVFAAPSMGPLVLIGLALLVTLGIEGSRRQWFSFSSASSTAATVAPSTEPPARLVDEGASTSASYPRSKESQISTALIFDNRLADTVLVSWIDYEGKEVLYRELATGQSYTQPTFATHLWRIRRRLDGSAVKTIVAGARWETVTIGLEASVEGQQAMERSGASTPPSAPVTEKTVLVPAESSIADEVFQIGTDVASPVPIVTPKPAYPSAARQAKIQGNVLLQCVVEIDGSVNRCSVARSVDGTFGLDEEAIKTAQRWRFQPGTRLGEPVAVQVSIEMSFILK